MFRLFVLEGPFQSDALLVPEGCLFDHIHNASRCWPFVRWNQTGAAACQERGMQMRSFAMLLPCGISLFSGVEFVCCPKHFKSEYKWISPLKNHHNHNLNTNPCLNNLTYVHSSFNRSQQFSILVHKQHPHTHFLTANCCTNITLGILNTKAFRRAGLTACQPF